MSSSTKRAKLSGAAYRRQREERRKANQRSANVINFDTIINDFAALKSRKVI